ncbi:MAG: hypothetical protein DRI57_17430 [Deltaproteobacteria bacterium]|nr:MAG: hypothetical protein DRI57_17430 [Deltaproteobacteria bacterium]
MQRVEYHTTILNNGQLPLPGKIRSHLKLRADQKIRVIIEVPNPDEHRKRYSFEKVRGLLDGIKGNMSSEILADRKDRI